MAGGDAGVALGLPASPLGSGWSRPSAPQRGAICQRTEAVPMDVNPARAIKEVLCRKGRTFHADSRSAEERQEKGKGEGRRTKG